MADFRGLGPAMAGPKVVDLARAGLGSALGLALAGLALQRLGIGWLIAPFGASAVLVYAVPNSPLAQPWSVVLGNTVSALVALAVVAALPRPDWAVPLAVGLAIAAMLTLRALHPPGGAVALLVALGGTGGWEVTLATVALGSALLVALGVVWNRAVGRAYPFRQPATPQAGASTPEVRIGLSPVQLARILEDYHQSTNLGVADLARLVDAAETAAAARRIEEIPTTELLTTLMRRLGEDQPRGPSR